MTRLLFLSLLLAGCTSAQLEQVDPTVYVPGEWCLDAHGKYQPVVAGTYCCGDGFPGTCPEEYACKPPDECVGPVPPNTTDAARKPVKRSGL